MTFIFLPSLLLPLCVFHLVYLSLLEPSQPCWPDSEKQYIKFQFTTPAEACSSTKYSRNYTLTLQIYLV